MSFCHLNEVDAHYEVLIVGSCRNQFPALPTTTPIIPSWQLQQLQLENTSKSSDGAKSQDMKAESEKDLAAEKQSDAEFANSDIPSTSVTVRFY